MELLIDKKYLLRLEKYKKFGYGGSFEIAARYVFSLPANAGIPEGYTVYIEAHEVEWDTKDSIYYNSEPLSTRELENGRTYRIDRDDEVYMATMTENREEGKRYKRYKFTAEELYALYQNVDLKSAQYAVAKVDIYIKGNEGLRHKIAYGNRIDKTVYLVGKVKGCWFYSSELDTKRNINSHGVTILGNIEDSSVDTIKELIKQAQEKFDYLKKVFYDVYDARDDIKRVLSEIRYFCDKKEVCKENADILKQVRSVQKQAKKAQEFINKRLSERDIEEQKIWTELELEMEKYYIKEGV